MVKDMMGYEIDKEKPIKIEFNYMKKSIVKLIDRELIYSIKKIEGIGDK